MNFKNNKKFQKAKENLKQQMQNCKNFTQLYCCNCLSSFFNQKYVAETQILTEVQSKQISNNDKGQKQNTKITLFNLPCSLNQNQHFNICSQCLSKSELINCVFCLKTHQIEQYHQNKQLILWLALSYQLKLVAKNKNQQPSTQSLIIYSMYQKLLQSNERLIRQNEQLKKQKNKSLKMKSVKQKIYLGKLNIRIIGLLLFILMTLILAFSKKNQIIDGITKFAQPMFTSKQSILFQSIQNLKHFNIQNNTQQGYFTIQKKQFDYNFASIVSNKISLLDSHYVQFQIQKSQKGWLYFGLVQQQLMNLTKNHHQHSGFYGYSGYSGKIYQNGQKTAIKCNKIQYKDIISLKIEKNKENKIKICYFINNQYCGQCLIALSSNQLTDKQHKQLSIQQLTKSISEKNYYLVVQMYNKGDIVKYISK